MAELDGQGSAVSPEEKPTAPRSGLAIVGARLFTPAAHEAARAIRPSLHEGTAGADRHIRRP
ncbi:hypothetical protein [Streptomyces sp. NPDC055886]